MLILLILELIKPELLYRSVHLHAYWLMHTHRLLHSHWLLHAHWLLHSHWLLHAHGCLHSYWLIHHPRTLHSLWEVLKLFHHIYLLKVNILHAALNTRLICLSNIHFNTSGSTRFLISRVIGFLLLILILHLGLHLGLKTHIEVHIHSHSAHWILLAHWHLTEILTSLYRLLLCVILVIHLIIKLRNIWLCFKISKLLFRVNSLNFGAQNSLVLGITFDSFHSLRISASERLNVIIMMGQHLVYTSQTVVGILTVFIFAFSV